MLQGDLADFTLPDILRLLSLTAKSGRLELQSAHGRGRVDLADGAVGDASADADRLPLARRLIGRAMVDGDTLRRLLGGATTLPTDLELARQLVEQDLAGPEQVAEVLREQTVDAVFDLLRWPNGSFQFDTRPADAGTPPALELVVDDLLAEVAQRLDRWETIAERTGPGHAVVTVGRPERTAVEVDADGWQLLGLADGQRTVDDLAALSGRGQFDTREALVRLLDLGVITIGEQGSAGSIDRLLADHRILVDLEGGVPVPQPSDPAGPADADDLVATDEGTTSEPDGPTPREDAVDPEPVSAEPVAPDQVDPDPVTAAPATPEPVAVEQADPVPLTVSTAATPAAATVSAAAAGGVTPLRRNGRLRTDPSVDADLVSRLIDGVEGM